MPACATLLGSCRLCQGTIYRTASGRPSAPCSVTEVLSYFPPEGNFGEGCFTPKTVYTHDACAELDRLNVSRLDFQAFLRTKQGRPVAKAIRRRQSILAKAQ
jgi:hypothetical protein